METKATYFLDLSNYYGQVTLFGAEGNWRLELDSYDSTDTLAIPDYLAEAIIKFINE